MQLWNVLMFLFTNNFSSPKAMLMPMDTKKSYLLTPKRVEMKYPWISYINTVCLCTYDVGCYQIYTLCCNVAFHYNIQFKMFWSEIWASILMSEIFIYSIIFIYYQFTKKNKTRFFHMTVKFWDVVSFRAFYINCSNQISI